MEGLFHAADACEDVRGTSSVQKHHVNSLAHLQLLCGTGHSGHHHPEQQTALAINQTVKPGHSKGSYTNITLNNRQV